MLRQLDGLQALVAEVDVREVDGISDGPNVSRMSLDYDVHTTAVSSSNGLARVVAGGAAAASMYSAIGRNIGVAVIDSGIRDTPDLEPVMKVDFVEDGRTSDTDPFGHGSHVAGIIGGMGETAYGRYMGMAPGARLVDVRVLDEDGNGKTSDVIAGIEWVIKNRYARGYDGKPLNIRVINLSLGHIPYESADTDPLTLVAVKR